MTNELTAESIAATWAKATREGWNPMPFALNGGGYTGVVALSPQNEMEEIAKEKLAALVAAPAHIAWLLAKNARLQAALEHRVPPTYLNAMREQCEWEEANHAAD